MSQTAREEFYTKLNIIGTTTPSEGRFPERLEPVYRSVHGPEVVLVPIDERGPHEPRLLEEDEAWLAEQMEEGGLQLFPTPIPAKADHVLWLFQPEDGPELVPQAEVEARLRRFYWDTLLKVEKLLEEQSFQSASDVAAQALRAADRRDSFSRLLQLALARRCQRSQVDLEQMEQSLKGRFTPLARQEDLRRFSQESVQYGLKRVYAEAETEARRHKEQSLESSPPRKTHTSASKALPSSPTRPRPGYLPSSSRSAPERPLTLSAA